MLLKKQAAGWLVVLSVFAIALLIITFPKSLYGSGGEGMVISCNCLGSEFWYGTKCIGLPVSCTTKTIVTEEQLCEAKSCDEVLDALKSGSGMQAEVSRLIEQTSIGTDVVLVMDVSNSMEGEKLVAAKHAAQRLVDSLQSNDRIALVTFSNNASVVAGFTSDKRNLTEGILSLMVMGGTNYLPGLQSAEQLLEEQSATRRKGIIFFSDGAPTDDKSDIVRKSESLLANDISLFTISFGIEALNGSNVLQQMVKSAEGGTQRWYRSYKETENIADAFYEAWREIRNLKVITVIPTFEKNRVSTDELSRVGIQARLIDMVLTTDREAHLFCDPQIEGRIAAKDTATNRTVVHALETVNDRFVLPADSLTTGTYELEASVLFETDHGQSCVFTGRTDLGMLTVLEQATPCSDVTCSQASIFLQDSALALREGIFVPRTKAAARVVMVLDTSESMERHLSEAAETARSLNQLLSSSDQRVLIGFSDQAFLLVPLTKGRAAFDQGLSKLSAAGTTRLVPALRKTSMLLSSPSATQDVVFIITDGMPYDEGGQDAILQEVDALVRNGTCLFVLGYGTDLLRSKESSALFKEVARRSQRATLCGGYVIAPDAGELSAIVVQAFGQSVPAEGPVQVWVQAPEEARFPEDVEIEVRVVSTATNMLLPVKVVDACIPNPLLSLRLLDGRQTVYEFEGRIPDDGVLRKRLPTMLPGKYMLAANVTVPVEEGCSFSSSARQEVVVRGFHTTVTEWLVMACIAVLLFAVLFSGVQVVRQLQG